ASLAGLASQASDTPGEWEQARKILCQEKDISDMAAGLRLLPAISEEVARAVERSKAKDDERGVRIMDDYGESHVEASRDPIVRQAWEGARLLHHESNEALQRLTHPASG